MGASVQQRMQRAEAGRKRESSLSEQRRMQQSDETLNVSAHDANVPTYTVSRTFSMHCLVWSMTAMRASSSQSQSQSSRGGRAEQRAERTQRHRDADAASARAVCVSGYSDGR